MKKMISTLLTVAMLFSLTAHSAMAETVDEQVAQVSEVDGVIDIDLNSIGQTPISKSDNAVLKYSIWNHWSMVNEEASEAAPYVDFTVSADQGGEYFLNAKALCLNVSYGADWSITVNPAEEGAKTYNMTGNNVAYNKNNGLDSEFEYTGGTVTLKSGVNTIRITSLEPNFQSSEGRRVMIQHIYLFKNQVQAYETNGVLELVLNQGNTPRTPLASSTNATVKATDYSGLTMTPTDTSGEAPWITFGVNVEGGLYKMSTLGGAFGNASTSDWTITVDDVTTYTWGPVKDASFIYPNKGSTSLDSEAVNSSSVFNQCIPLSKGYHVLKITATDDYKGGGNGARVFIKTITFENNPVNAIESDDNISLTLGSGSGGKVVGYATPYVDFSDSATLKISGWTDALQMTDTTGAQPWIDFAINADGGSYRFSTIANTLTSGGSYNWNVIVDPGTEEEKQYLISSATTTVGVTDGSFSKYIAKEIIQLTKGRHVIRISAADGFKNTDRILIRTIEFERNPVQSVIDGETVTLTLCNNTTVTTPLNVAPSTTITEGEGEEAITKTISTYYRASSGCILMHASDGTMSGNFAAVTQADYEPWIEYCIEAPSAGYYIVKANGVDLNYAADYDITVNGTTAYTVNAGNISYSTEGTFRDYEYMAKCVYLNEGKNIIRFTNKTCNNVTESRRRFFTKFVTFSKIEGAKVISNSFICNSEDINGVLPQDGNVEAKVSIANATAELLPIIVVAGVYNNNGDLVSVEVVPISLEAGERTINSDAVFKIKRTADEKLNIKLLVWNADTFEPILDAPYEVADVD